jgi:hypothetical protein
MCPLQALSRCSDFTGWHDSPIPGGRTLLQAQFLSPSLSVLLPGALSWPVLLYSTSICWI